MRSKRNSSRKHGVTSQRHPAPSRATTTSTTSTTTVHLAPLAPQPRLAFALALAPESAERVEPLAPPVVGSTSNDTAVGAPAPLARGMASVTPEERRSMIARAAFRRAEQGGIGRTDPLHDWLSAEREVDASLGLRAS
jgi:hypothetical protein